MSRTPFECASRITNLGPEQKAVIRLFACDMHEPFKKAIRDDPALAHAAIVHDPFHVIERAGEAITELRRSIFFRSSPGLREVGRGARWLVLRSWDHSSDEQRSRLRLLFRHNGKLARAYQLVEEYWETLVRRGRGYGNHAYLLAKLRFITANPIRSADGIKRFLALGLPTPLARTA